ncbi:MAG: peptidase C39 family protein [Thaumarchaeota archaeon]|nr:peptidase C39 family protein [Nitrososphaerota archaeon]
MAMKYLDESISLSKDLVMDIWREANMVESYRTSRYGLTFAAAKGGFKARVHSNIEGYGFLNELEPPIEGLNHRMLKLFFEERKKRCKKLGVREERRRITLGLIRRSLASRAVPLLLTNARNFSEKENLPHWIVVTGVDTQRLYVNNSLATRKKKEE